MVIFHSYVSLPEVTIELLYPNQWFQQAEVAMLSEARGETWQWYTMIIHGQGAIYPNSSEWMPSGHRIAILISWKHGNCIWGTVWSLLGPEMLYSINMCVSCTHQQWLEMHSCRKLLAIWWEVAMLTLFAGETTHWKVFFGCNSKWTAEYDHPLPS